MQRDSSVDPDRTYSGGRIVDRGPDPRVVPIALCRFHEGVVGQVRERLAKTVDCGAVYRYARVDA